MLGQFNFFRRLEFRSAARNFNGTITGVHRASKGPSAVEPMSHRLTVHIFYARYWEHKGPSWQITASQQAELCLWAQV
ncbi:hypothetical protein AB1N83_009713 [Pleurotus pulmonarius]